MVATLAKSVGEVRNNSQFSLGLRGRSDTHLFPLCPLANVLLMSLWETRQTGMSSIATGAVSEVRVGSFSR